MKCSNFIKYSMRYQNKQVLYKYIIRIIKKKIKWIRYVLQVRISVSKAYFDINWIFMLRGLRIVFGYW